MRFQVPTRIIFGSGVISELKDVIKNDLNGSGKIFLITDEGIRNAGICDEVLNRLPDANEVEVFDKVEQNPRHETVDQAGERARQIEPTVIIGLGGGSVLDAAKAIALLAKNPGHIEDYEGKRKYLNPPLPVLAVPTTCGTGSEVTWVSVITHSQRNFKMSIKGPEMFPAVALVDPDLLSSLPPALVASTGMDALVHAVEAYSVKPATFITDIFAREAIRLILSALPEAYRDIKAQHTARENLMKGSMLAGMAFGNSDVGAVHCISESIGALFDTPHGVANSIFLPYVMEFNLTSAVGRYADVAGLAGICEEDEETAALKLIEKIKALSLELNIPTFRELGIPEDRFPEIARKSFANNSNPSNPREASEEDYLNILQNAYQG